MGDPMIQIRIETPEKAPIYREAERLTVWSHDGIVEILPDHGPIVLSLGVGVARLYQGENEEKLALYRGMLHCSHNEVIMLCLNSEKADEVNEERARESLARAARRLEGRDPELERSMVDFKRLESSRKRALVRLELKGSSS
jgi:F-type H+-transporting ATPase subunit epsilon